MSRLVLLASVQEEGAVELLTTTLADAGIATEVKHVPRDHPYQPVARLAWRVSVPSDRLVEARGILSLLELEIERDLVTAAGPPEDFEPRSSGHAGLGVRARWRPVAGLLLATIIPFPVACFLAGLPTLGAVLLGTFLSALLRTISYERGTAPVVLAIILVAAKVLDLAVALVAMSVGGRRASSSGLPRE